MAKLVRHSDTGWFGGVCSGIAATTGIDVNIIRVLTVLGVIFGFGSLAIVYIVLWVVLPKNDGYQV